MKPYLPIDRLSDRHPGLTDKVADCYSEAARVCLDRHHQPPTDFEIRRADQKTAAIANWQVTDERTRGAWANDTDTTEAGAYACTLAAVELSVGLVAVRRAETRTGADYYVAATGASPVDLEDCIRLEVSGIDQGDDDTVGRRLTQKLKQAERGNSNLPAMAGVVGFQARTILLADLDEA